MRYTSAPNEQREIPTTSSPLPAVLRDGQIVGGRYKIERYVGGGGMASIYRALHIGLDQPVALKVVSPLLRELPGSIARFMREARAATRFKGEHVVRVFDVGVAEDDAPYLVMELLEGQDLREMLARGYKPTVEQAIDYVLQACEALAEVHGLGIVHRDLKPANLFVTRGPDGLDCLKLIDFGISRMDSPLPQSSAHRGGVEDAAGLQTSSQVVMGSPRYMPPEQMESATGADTRSDIWGLGAILYELLVGDSPFDGESLLDIYAAAVRSPPPAPSSLRDDLPTELDDVLLRCLRVDPSDRYADVAELAAALAPFGDENAYVRADAIAHILANSRGHSGDSTSSSGLLNRATHDEASKVSPSSRIRRRLDSVSVRARRRRHVAAMIGVGAIVGMGLMLGALHAFGFIDLAPSIDIKSSTSAATMTTCENASMGEACLPNPATPAPAPTHALTAAPTRTPTTEDRPKISEERR